MSKIPPELLDPPLELFEDAEFRAHRHTPHLVA
jgi:hypothetical protein